ncbi:hypothetical protein ALC60_02584 [Trachymyrmex zeteki]|nr:hypothetical protein ALC60_02584 [Trachymyrmex zeteki]
MFRLPSYTSIFSAEAYAIYTAVTLSTDLKLPKASIITDSKSVLEDLRWFLRGQLKPWYYRTKISREIIVMINRLRSDHYNLNSSLHRKNLIEDPSCSCGYPQQDILHMIFDCSIFSDGARLLHRLIDRASPSGDKLTKFTRAISKPSECFDRLILNFSKFCCRQF